MQKPDIQTDNETKLHTEMSRKFDIFSCCDARYEPYLLYQMSTMSLTEVMQTGVSGSGVKVVMEMMGAVRPKANSQDIKHVLHAFFLVHMMFA